MTVKIYFEPLYHCTCETCKDWWNISDKELTAGSPIFCSNCGAKHEIPTEIHTKSESVKLLWVDGEWVRSDTGRKVNWMAARNIDNDVLSDFDPDDYPLA